MAKSSTPKIAKLTRGQRNCAWIEHNCVVPEGKLVGQDVKLREWQKKVICRIYDNPRGKTRMAIISFGRKNGKTGLASFLLLLHLCGPEAVPNGQLYSAAQSRDQASILFSLAAKCVRQSETLNPHIQVVDSAKKLVCPGLGTVYRALSADASTAYGLSPTFIVHDELGQVKGPRSELFEALESACAANENPLSIIISTQAPTDKDLLSLLIDDAKSGDDPRTILELYTAPMELDPFCEETLRLANPAFGDFQSAQELLSEAEKARRMPSKESSYRNLNLNQRVSQKNVFVSANVWKENGESPQDFGETIAFGGLDLSEVNDLTAFVRVAKIQGPYSIRATFWLPEANIHEKSIQDRTPYDLYVQQGLIETCPGNAIEYEYVASRIYDICQEERLAKIAFDRYNWKHLRPWLERAGFAGFQLNAEGSAEERSESLFCAFGQGFISMSPALRALETLLLNKRLRHGMHPVMTMCAANAVVQTDPAGNRKLTKTLARGRIDGLVALAMAIGVAEESEANNVSRGSIYDNPAFWN